MPRYDRIAASLHWTVAALVVVQFATGWGWAVFERGSLERLILFRTHIALGSAILALAILRIVWRLTHRPPPLPAGMTTAQRMLAALTHGTLYAVIVVQPLLGLLAITAFGKSLGRWPREVHTTATWLILALVLLHIAAALWHQFVRRDDLLTRMTLGR